MTSHAWQPRNLLPGFCWSRTAWPTRALFEGPVQCELKVSGFSCKLHLLEHVCHLHLFSAMHPPLTASSATSLSTAMLADWTNSSTVSTHDLISFALMPHSLLTWRRSASCGLPPHCLPLALRLPSEQASKQPLKQSRAALVGFFNLLVLLVFDLSMPKRRWLLRLHLDRGRLRWPSGWLRSPLR